MDRYAIIADRMWDGVAESAVNGAAVVVCGPAIESIVDPSELPSNLPRLQLDGCTLLPGLIDGHVHYSRAMGPAFLAAGVTTVRDTGNDLEWILSQREMNASDPARGPTILCCGFLLDGPQPYWNRIGQPHADVESTRASVRHHVARGVDAIKLYDGLEPDLLFAAVAEARAAGKAVLAHLGKTTAGDAIRAGINEIEHLDGCPMAWRHSLQSEDDAFIDLLLEHAIVLMPTLVVWDRLGRILEHSFTQDLRRQWVHPGFLDIWDRYPSRSAPPQSRLRFQEPIPHLKRFLLRAHQRGAVVGLGTDSPFPHLIPGFSIHDELAMYVDAGIKPIDALRSATSVNARVLGVDSRTGIIVPGLIADLCAVRGDPAVRIHDIANVALVVHAGRVVNMADLLKDIRKLSMETLTDPIASDLLGYVNRNA